MGNVIKKLVVGIVIGGILFGATNVLGFPLVFQMLFFGYAMLGTVVFIILDLPPLKPFGGVKAAGALIGFYAILSAAYVAGGAVWPQFDPEDEKGKIDKILKPKREQYEAGKVNVDDDEKRRWRKGGAGCGGGSFGGRDGACLNNNRSRGGCCRWCAGGDK